MMPRPTLRPPLLLSAAAALLASSSSSSSTSAMATATATSSSSLSSSSGGSRAAGVKKDLLDLDCESFPQRTSEEAAVVEWGHSAIISALDAVVAGFGTQTSRGAFFEVEAAPVLADPIDGVGEKTEAEYPGPLKNSDEIHGNMAVITNHADLSPVMLTRIAKDSGAAALMVVNTADGADQPDYVYRMEAETDEEARWAEENVDIPVVMVSRTSGNVLTTATIPEEMRNDPNAAEHAPNGGMPDRVRLYAGGDRPFFEDAAPDHPTIYLIHNMLSGAECAKLIDSAEKAGFEYDGKLPGEGNGGRVALWRGQLEGHAGKQIEERMEQVMGYPAEHYSDWQISKYTSGGDETASGGGMYDDGYADPHYDYATAPPRATKEQQEAAIRRVAGLRPHQHPITHTAMATVSVFLNEPGPSIVSDGEGASAPAGGGGGEIFFPNIKDLDPLKVAPRVGLAVVHHNTDAEGSYDPYSVHADMPLTGGGGGAKVKYVARKFVYDHPLPPSRRVVLPFLAMPLGGRIPGFVADAHDALLDRFGPQDGTKYFDKLAVFVPLLILLGVASAIGQVVQKQMGGGGGGGESSKAKAGDGKKRSADKKVKKESGKSKKKKA
uniref:Prolyl 4-hydroxylase alpha subunit domain-containing protein n=1 Tax=Odontella aurita TaxID=265563 RepID=A0A7S4K5L6_9STRA|mmetsp:Transcript_62093/g.183509  ORF Transcript_62093/g.183509 Transcript_62093/m.183509 type:complete len:608 (+) Transcript_62093:127-1950(+)